MGFVEALEPRDQNRQDETFVDDLNGGASRDGFCIEMNELSSQDTTSTGMRDEIVLLAWALVLMRRKEGALPRFEWAHLAEGKPVINQLPTEEVFPSLQLTTRKVAASILQLIQNATRTKHVPGASALLLSSNSLSKDSEVTKNEETKHIEIRFSAGQIQIRTIWCSVNTLPHTVAHTIRTFVDTIRACIANPEETIEQALQATESDFDEIWRLCHELPPTHRFCMHEKISERARRLDEKVGISSWDGDLTYWQIDQWSSHFAGLLKNRVQPQDVVPICFEKSRWTVIALLATMKAGATFVLMDPTLPLARLQNMAKQVGAKAMVSSRKQFELASSILPAEKILVVERQAFKAIERTWEIAELPKVDPSTLMYIIFTSGSTGTPKGVQISHETYTSSAIPRAKAVGYTEESRVLDFASYAFDVSIDSMLLTLGNGGCLCIPSDEDRMNDINGVIRNMNINYAGLTPSVGRILDPDVIRSLTGGLGLGGEAVSARDATVWGKDARIVIGYGPCECTIGCTVNSSAATGRDYVSIGPGNGAVIWIVDPNDHTVLMPVGAVGELLVEGPIVGQGYLNDPEKTASAFINDPPWLLAGHKQYAGRSGRLYKTGDLGKYDPDGSGGIVFAGRKDTQVKLRGQRVELGEIESQLRERLPADVNIIAEVIAPQGASGQPTLVAFVTCPAMKSGVGISIATPPDELSTVLSTVNVELSKAVPRYMVPTAYIPVNNIPVLISGKTDRKQLRQFGNGIELRELSKGGNPSIFRKLNKLEERMRQAWSTVLKLDVGKIQPEDNFFALGGDSLAAMKLVSASRSQGLDLSVMSMFANPSLSEMASVTQPFDSESQPEVVPFSLLSQSSESAVQEASETYGFAPSAIEDIYPCTPTQESLFTFSLKSEKPYIAQRVASIPSHIHTETWKSAWERVVSEIPILRTRLAQLQEPGLQQVILKSKVAWKDSINLDQYLTADKAMRMNLGDDLARYAIVHAQDGKRYMVWTIHHIVYDGWSEPVILRQVCHALKDEPLEIMTQMRDFVKYVKDTDESAMQEFWRRELKGAIGPQFPRLPSRDFLPNPDGLVEGDITVGISPGYPFTMATLIRGAWALVASQYSGNDDVVFGETLTGRDISLLGVEGIIGPLIATVPVRVRAQRSMSIEAFLRSVQQGALARTPYQHMGMQNIRKVSYDAQHACEAPTGLVIQPEPDFGGSELGFEIGDVVLEALHFNPYPLMIVSQMRRVLAQMQEACTQLTQDLSRPLGNVSFVSEIELDQIWEWNETPPLSFDQGSSTLRSGENTKSGENYPRAVIPWVCDPRNPCILSPIGCLGELWLEGNCLPGKTESSKWLEKGSSSFPGRIGKLQSTGDIVTQKENGSITFVGKKESIFVQGHAVNTAELDIHLARYLPPTVRAATGMLSPSKDEKQQDHIVFLQSNSAKEKHTEIIPTSREMDLPNQKIHFFFGSVQPLCRIEKT
ncbi:Nonribosomal peptide synthetase 4 [Penicillium chermesinum]|uniref:Nonribosomal peptide synthetase 4 n=1 Tax=Penicillium chermesinum TaxID=63820 RepID=A0A9W9NIB9_9EURO|nr:Nonribosomal peptide synthetase 4 [Penicillium chermesinum]KAJ5220432.1 Nonribosomal peptide synthetase 4 [Penicillium chermesinum]